MVKASSALQSRKGANEDREASGGPLRSLSLASVSRGDRSLQLHTLSPCASVRILDSYCVCSCRGRGKCLSAKRPFLGELYITNSFKATWHYH